MYEYKAKVIRVIDADTIELDVDCGFHCHFTEKFRLARINAPELSTSEGQTAKAFVQTLLPIGKEVTIKSSRRDTAIREEKYGRWLAEVILMDNTNLSDYLLQEGKAKPWI